MYICFYEVPLNKGLEWKIQTKQTNERKKERNQKMKEGKQEGVSNSASFSFE
jgi:hypothetical protein